MKKVLVVICIVMMLCQCGCRGFFLNEEKERETKGFVTEEIDVESENPVLYSKIAVIDNSAKYPELMRYDESYAKYGSAGVALIWKLERNSKENEKIHVIVKRRKWPPTSVFLPGSSLGQRSLVDYIQSCCCCC